MSPDDMSGAVFVYYFLKIIKIYHYFSSDCFIDNAWLEQNYAKEEEREYSFQVEDMYASSTSYNWMTLGKSLTLQASVTHGTNNCMLPSGLR